MWNSFTSYHFWKVSFFRSWWVRLHHEFKFLCLGLKFIPFGSGSTRVFTEQKNTVPWKIKNKSEFWFDDKPHQEIQMKIHRRGNLQETTRRLVSACTVIFDFLVGKKLISDITYEKRNRSTNRLSLASSNKHPHHLRLPHSPSLPPLLLWMKGATSNNGFSVLSK